MEHARGDLIAKETELVLSRVRHTDFEHEHVVDPETGTYKVDDAAFVGLLLEHSAPEEFARIQKRTHKRYPRAIEIYDFLVAHSHHGWERVVKLAEARPGDIIAWKPSKTTRERDGGHVAVVARAPEFDTETETWTVCVHDSSSVAHFDDSRVRGRKYHPGVGSGALKFRADSQGAPAAVQVGPNSKFHKYLIVIGRLKEGSRAAQSHAKYRAANGATSSGCRIERAATANETLSEGEFAFTTYTLVSSDGMLLLPTTIACWGPGQMVSASLGSGAAIYSFVGGVVFRNLG
jgi:hypothetical protein